jgi:predicted Rossmann-fold nucleotide-binding protein
MPGGFGTLDEMFEAMTLIQTRKIKDFPVIIFDSEYHKELMEHINKMLLAKTISASDLELFLVTDSVEEAKEMIRKSIHRFGLSHERPHPLRWLLEIGE